MVIKFSALRPELPMNFTNLSQNTNRFFCGFFSPLFFFSISFFIFDQATVQSVAPEVSWSSGISGVAFFFIDILWLKFTSKILFQNPNLSMVKLL